MQSINSETSRVAYKDLRNKNTGNKNNKQAIFKRMFYNFDRAA